METIIVTFIFGIIFPLLFFYAVKKEKKRAKKDNKMQDELIKKYGHSKFFYLSEYILVILESGIMKYLNISLYQIKELDLKTLLKYEIKENNVTYSKDGLSGAIIGGLLFGGAGAIVGATTQQKQVSELNTLEVLLYFKNFQNPISTITWYNKQDNVTFQSESLKNFIATLEVILDQNKQTSDVINNESEIKGLKSDEKECPQCAEIIKEKAKICRFCNYKFEEN